MSRWENTKYISSNPTFLQRLYALIFMEPIEILLPGNEWVNCSKGTFQRPIKPHKPKLTLVRTDE